MEQREISDEDGDWLKALGIQVRTSQLRMVKEEFSIASAMSLPLASVNVENHDS